MSGLLFNAGYIVEKAACWNANDERRPSKEKGETKESWTHVTHLSPPSNSATWRRKQKTKSKDAFATGGSASPEDGDWHGHARSESTGRGRTYGICCPTQFFCDEFKKRVEANRAHENQQWIFNLIYRPEETTETIFENKGEWMLVQGCSFNGDARYLVIFKDTELKTIRDLRQKHLPLLEEVQDGVLDFLKRKRILGDYKMYFHYLPSVFQLHMHVCSSSSGESIRRQYLNCVMRNIAFKDTWYQDALILFAPPRPPRAQSVREVGNVVVSDDMAADKPDGVCI